MCARVRACERVYTCHCVYACACERACACACVCVCVCTNVCARASVYACHYVHACVCVCVRACARVLEGVITCEIILLDDDLLHHNTNERCDHSDERSRYTVMALFVISLMRLRLVNLKL